MSAIEILKSVNTRIMRCPDGCKCTTMGCKDWLHGMHIWPSPGYFGKSFDTETDVLFIAQNPGKPVLGVDSIQYANDTDMSVEYRMRAYGNVLRHHYRATQEIMRELKIDFDHFAWTNVVKCPVDNNRPVHAVEYDLCKHWLREQCSILQPKLCVAIGSYAANYFGNGSIIQHKTHIRTLQGGSVIFRSHYAHSDLGAWITDLKFELDKVRGA